MKEPSSANPADQLGRVGPAQRRPTKSGDDNGGPALRWSHPTSIPHSNFSVCITLSVPMVQKKTVAKIRPTRISQCGRS